MKLGKKALVVALTVAAISVAAVTPVLAANGNAAGSAQTATQAAQGTRPAGAGESRVPGGNAIAGAAGNMIGAVTDLLGVTAADIVAARQQGQSLAQIAAGKGISLETLVGAITTQRKSDLDLAVTSGRVTQDQADLMLKNMKERITKRVQDPSLGPPADRAGFGQRGTGQRGNTGAYCPVPAA